MDRVDPEAVTEEIRFVCPFCGQNASAAFDQAGRGMTLHGLPMCPTFEKLGPDAYLRAVRKRWQS